MREELNLHDILTKKACKQENKALSIVAFVITVASHDAINLPWIVGKNSVGRFPFWLV